MTKHIYSFLLVILLFTPIRFYSQAILTFEFAGLAGSEPTANSNFNNAGLNTSTISRGTGLTASANADRFNATNWALTSIANAVSGNNYMEFTISPLAGYEFTVSSITISLQRSGTGPSAIALRSSADGYTSNLDAVKTIVDNTSTQTFTFTFTQSSTSSPISYRMYMYAEAIGGSGGPGDFTGNDIIVNGTVSAIATNTITTGTVSGSPFGVDCVTGASGSVSFTSTGTFNAGNIYTAQLSDATGSFTSPIDIGTLSSTSNSGSISIIIPAATASGSGYKIRITGSSPATIGSSSTDFTINSTCGPTILQSGEIAILAFNTDVGGGVDEISFVCFVDINPGTIIDITDNAYQKCGTPNGWGISEGWIRIQRTNSILPAGEVVTIQVTSGLPSPLSPDLNWIGSKPQPSGQGSFDMNANGEQIFFLSDGSVGGPNTNTAASDAGTYSGHFLYGFNTKGNVWTPICGTAAAGGTQNSDKPLNFDCYLVWPTAQADKNKYTGPLSPTTQRNWIDRIGNPSNWTGYPDNATYNAGTDYVNFNGPLLGRTIVIQPGGFSAGKWVGTTDVNWFNCSNWENMLVPDANIDVLIPSSASNIAKIDYSAPYSDAFNDTAKCKNLLIEGREVNLEGNTSNILVVHGNLTIQNDVNARLDMNDGGPGADGQLILHGNWINNKGLSEFMEGHGTVKLVGNANQSISSVAAKEAFYHLQINKTGGSVLLNIPIEIGGASSEPISDRNGILTLTSGHINTGSHFVYVTNPSIAAISGGSITSFIDGRLQRHTQSTALYDFPTGNGIRFMRAGLRTANAAENVLEIIAYDNGLGTYTPLETGLFDVSSIRWWDISHTSGVTPVTVRLYWSILADDQIVDATQLVVAHWSNRNHAGVVDIQQWWNRGRNAGNSTATVANGYVESSEWMTSFSPFTFGTLDPINPLPIELIHFSGTCTGQSRYLTWSTASETNNAYFNLEKSLDAETFFPIALIQGAGNSNTLQTYSYTDTEKNSGAYYRLQQVDNDNQSETFAPIYVSCHENNNEFEVSLLSVIEQQVLIHISGAPAEFGPITMYDFSGRAIAQKNISLNGTVSFEIGDLAKGWYILQIMAGDEVRTLRFFRH